MLEDGRRILSDSIANPDLAPRESKILDLNLEAIKPEQGAEYLLNVFIRTAEPSELIPESYETAKEQFVLPFRKQSNRTEEPSGFKLDLAETENEVYVKGREFSVRFEKSTGLLSSFLYKGTKLLLAGPTPDFWRAPTDNDFGNRMPRRCAVWKNASSNRQLGRFEIQSREDTRVRIEVEYSLPDVSSQHTVTYTVLNTGDLIVDNHFLPGEKELPELLRFGMRMNIPGNFRHVQWYGRGPHENYWDRKTSAFIGLYANTVQEQYVNYASPQENGYRTDTRWLVLMNKQGAGLLVTGMPVFCFSALYYTIEDLTQSSRGTMHTTDLIERDFISLNLDYKQTGVGGNDSWGARPLPKYTLHPQNYNYKFRLRPFTRGENLAELCKQRL